MHQDANPYAPPKHDEAAPVARTASESSAHLEAIRSEHINAETNVKQLGFLLYLGAAALILGGLAQLTGDAALGGINIVFGAALGAGGYWLRRLDNRGRLVYSIITALGVVGVLFVGEAGVSASYQLGRLFWPLLFVGLLWGTKASTVMTPHYRDVVIPATPHVKRKTSVITIVVFVLLLLLLAAVIFANVVA